MTTDQSRFHQIDTTAVRYVMSIDANVAERKKRHKRVFICLLPVFFALGVLLALYSDGIIGF